MELTKLGVYLVRNELFPSNTYILKGEDNTCIIIDPGLQPEKIDAQIRELQLTPLAVIATHGHFDHMASVSFFKEKYSIPYYLHESDFKLSQSANFYLKLTRINFKIKTPVPDVLFKGKNQTLNLGGFTLIIHNFPGHSNGSCIVQHGNCLFSGDIMYKKGLGFNNFPGEDTKLLKKSILEVFSTFDKNAIVLPGHGEPDLLGNIRSNNQELINFLN